MIELTALQSLILTYAPVIIALLGIIAACLKVVSLFKKIKNDNDSLVKTVRKVLNENYSLKSQINELLTKIDHVKRD